jgi:hypothetical protein
MEAFLLRFIFSNLRTTCSQIINFNFENFNILIVQQAAG